MTFLTDLPARVVTTDDNFWKAVGLISGARRYGNRNVQFPKNRSRGFDGDIRTEIMGVWGELTTWKWSEEVGLDVSIPCLVSLTGPSTEVDFNAMFEGQPYGLEAKSWALYRVDGSKSDPFSTVNINVKGHLRSYERGGDYYVFSFGAIGGDATLVGRPYPHELVTGWKKNDGNYGDPYLARTIKDLIPEVVPGKNAWKMAAWIEKTAVARSASEELISSWREAAEGHIDAVMEACKAKTSAEFFEAVRGIK